MSSETDTYEGRDGADRRGGAAAHRRALRRRGGGARQAAGGATCRAAGEKPAGGRGPVRLVEARLAPIRYALNHRNGLVRFLDDGRVELDTNTVERAIRPPCLGRKNALFASGDDGGARWTALALPVETCKLNGVDPQRYFADLLTRLANGWPNGRIDDLMPWCWAKSDNAWASGAGEQGAKSPLTTQPRGRGLGTGESGLERGRAALQRQEALAQAGRRRALVDGVD
jgi:IS66 C-terminal element/Transposase IS66 family